jgi:two-component system sensor histidine kinase DegS
MKERIELLEGKITIDSKIGLGTFIMIQVPYQVG